MSPDGKALISSFNLEQDFILWKAVSPSTEHGDTPDTAFKRIVNKIPIVRANHYGIESADNPTRGTYGEWLEKVKWAQISLFGSMLKIWTNKVLNGDSNNPYMAKGGKLGFVVSVYKHLNEILNYFDGFIDDVFEKRSELNIEGKTKSDVENRQKNTSSCVERKAG